MKSLNLLLASVLLAGSAAQAADPKKAELLNASYDVARELFKVIVEMVDGVPLHRVGMRAQILVIRAAFRRYGFAALLDQAAGGRVDRQLQLAIGERGLNFLVKYG